MRTVYTHAPAHDHDLPNHPENAQRGPAVWSLLEKEQLLADLLLLDPVTADSAALEAVHSAGMLAYIEEISLRGGGRVDADTYATADSFKLATMAAGSVCQAAAAVANGRADNGYVFVRPPGHHAESQRPGGFCLMNNIAVGARYIQQQHGIKRLAIIDFDVHHGNGTQEIFYEDPSVLFVSSHQFGRFFYPGTGSLQEVGMAEGKGTTMNLPLAPGMGDQAITRLYKELVFPKLKRFNPDFILVSAGFDAHWIDPLASINLSLTGYAALARQLLNWSATVCNGKILFVQEGGYVFEALAHGVVNTVYACLGRDKVEDPLGPASQEEPEIEPLMTAVRDLHLI